MFKGCLTFPKLQNSEESSSQYFSQPGPWKLKKMVKSLTKQEDYDKGVGVRGEQRKSRDGFVGREN